MPLFTLVRGRGILRGSFAGSWIRPRNTPARCPCGAPIRARGDRYYPRLDAYALSWMLPPEKPPDEQAQPRGGISPALFGPLLPALFCLRSHILRGDRRAAGDLLAVVIGVLYHPLSSNPPRILPPRHPTLPGSSLCALLSPWSMRPGACPLRLFAALELPSSLIRQSSANRSSRKFAALLPKIVGAASEKIRAPVRKP
jgi:hypothetical protein